MIAEDIDHKQRGDVRALNEQVWDAAATKQLLAGVFVSF